MTRKNPSTPVGYDRRKVERAFARLDRESGFEARVSLISRLFLNRPYAENPLGGGPEVAERFRVSFDEFDCVTYVETVLAMACSKTPARFVSELKDLRYENGSVGWFSRNHFMTAWLRKNAARGAIADLTRGRNTIRKTRTLNGVAGLQPEEVTFRLFAKRSLAKVRARIRTGDVMMFVSIKKHLDVFHMGILIRENNRILLRHATRSVGKVIEQDLTDFFQANRMSGFILARPLCRP